MMTCIFCEREINNVGSLAAHQKVCPQNPNRIRYVRSAKAGAQKGQVPWNKGKKMGLTEYHSQLRRDDAEVFVENSTHARHLIRERLINHEMIDYQCEICGLGPVWQGKPMPLVLDHKNGVSNDNRIENLRFVCSNCDSQLPTYKSKNRKRKHKPRDSG